MEAISYVNIFETKGLEYLLVISFLVGFLLLVRYVASEEAAGPDSDAPGQLSTEAVNLPVACAADFECPYRTCLTDPLDGSDELEDEHSVAS